MGGLRSVARSLGLALAITATAGAAASEGEWIQVEPGPRHLWSGESVHLAVRAVNRDATSLSASFRWRFVLSGAVLARGDQSVRIPSGASERVRIDFEAPQVRRVCDVAWYLSLLRGEKTQAQRQVSFVLYPSWDPQPLQKLLDNRRVAIADPSGRLPTMLSNHGLTSRLLATPRAVSSFRGQVIVLGPGAGSSRRMTEAALEAAHSGSSVLWLDPGDTSRWQERFGLPEARRAEPGLLTVLAPGHPALGEIRPSDLESWRGDSGPGFLMTPPDGGNFRALVGARDNHEGLALLELFPGKGRIMLCHLPVVSRFAAEPAARLLFESLLRYALVQPPTFRPAAIWAPPESGLASLVEQAGTALAGRLPPRALFIVAADADAARYARSRSPALTDKIRAHLLGGGKCLFVGAEPDSLPWLRAAGLPALTFQPADQTALQPGLAPLAWGLCAHDLLAAARAGDQAPLFRHAVVSRKAAVAVSPGAVVKFRVGAGEAILCQLALDRAPDHPAAIAVLRQVLTNLATHLEREDQP